MSPLRIALVEDDPATLASLASALGEVSGLEVVATFADAKSAIDWFGSRPVPGDPGLDVVVVDIVLPGLDGIDLLGHLEPIHPGLRFLMLTLHADRHLIFNALRAGANGYVVKGCPLEELVAAIRQAHDGGMPFSIGVARRVREHFMALAVAPVPPEVLSGREAEVLSALARGASLKEVAGELGLSEHTVRTYLKRIYAKLKVRSGREAVARFLSR